MFPSVLLERLILVFAWCILLLVYGVELAGLLEDPTFSVGMICRFIGGAMDIWSRIMFKLDSSSLAPLEGGFC